jgi:voltage-gated potassium channel Kch
VGASIDFGLVLESPGLVFTLVLALIAIKLAILLGLGKVFKLALADNLMFAFILAQGGEFAFLLFSFATQNQVIDRDLANLLIVVVVLSMMATPLVIIVYERFIRPRFVGCASEPESGDIHPDDRSVIIAGYGRFGQIVSRMLQADGIQTTLLDHDAGQIELTGRFGNKVFYGDASRVELLRAAGAEQARLLIIAIDDRDKVVSMVNTAHQYFPGLKVLARAYDRSHAYQLMAAGADAITRETFGSALIMGESAFQLLGYDAAHAYSLMRTFRRHDESGLKKLYDVWGDDKAYGLSIKQSIEDLEKVLKNDSKDVQGSFRQAWDHLQSAEAGNTGIERPSPEGVEKPT